MPSKELWGPQTALAIDNFPISGLRMHPDLIRALAMIKAEAAIVNYELEVGAIDSTIAEAVSAASVAVAEGGYITQFPVDVFQTGSGTSTNMNVNEVIASLAAQTLGMPVHPNDHVNASQSSNDAVPTAARIAAASLIFRDLLPRCSQLCDELQSKASEFAHVVKAGRTHLMDAVPTTVGAEFASYASQVRHAMANLARVAECLFVLPLGGTAVGTGLNAPEQFGPRVVERLAVRTGLQLSVAANRLSLVAAHDDLVTCSAALRTLAISLVKIANDLRWMASGPETGLAEISLPTLQAGSSIMPGKINPVMPEVVVQVAAQVIGNDACIAFCGAQGAFELNATIPVVTHNLLQSIDLLSNVVLLFTHRCVAGIVVDSERCREFAGSSPAIATALVPMIGYDLVAEIVREASQTGRTITAVALERTEIEPAELRAILDLDKMASGG